MNHLSEEEHDALSKRCFDAALRKVQTEVFTQYFHMQLERDPSQVFKSKQGLEIYKWIQEIESEQSDDRRSSHVFITINPRSDVSLSDFHKKIKKALSKKWISWYCYCFEQRGENLSELGKGLHAHILINRGTEPNKVKREFQNTFKTLVGNKKHVDIRFIVPEHVERTIDYINGVKADADKQSKMDMDIMFREQNNLRSVYESQQEDSDN